MRYVDIVPRMAAPIKMPILTCLRCGGEWIPRRPEEPLRCAKCGSQYWSKPRRELSESPAAKAQRRSRAKKKAA